MTERPFSDPAPTRLLPRDQIDALRLVIDAIATRVRTDPDWLETMTPDTKALVRAVLKASLVVGGPEVHVTVH